MSNTFIAWLLFSQLLIMVYLYIAHDKMDKNMELLKQIKKRLENE